MAKKYFHRGLSLLVITLMLASLFPTTALAAADYSDVGKDASYYEAVVELRDKGLMVGTGNGLFSPDLALSRGMALTVLYRLAGSPKTDAASAFTDVREGEYYANAVAWAVEQGIAKGYGDGSFRPNQSLSEKDMNLFLSRYAGTATNDANVMGSSDIVNRAAFAAAVSNFINERVTLSVDSALYGTAFTKGYTTLKAEENGTVEYGSDSKAVIRVVTPDGSVADDAKIDASGAKVSLSAGDGYYVYDYVFSANQLSGSFENGELTYRLDSGDLVYNNDQGYLVDNGGLEWSAQGGNGGGHYVFNLTLDGVKYDGKALDPVTFPVEVYVYGREFSSRNSPQGASSATWGVGLFNALVFPVAEEKALESRPTVGVDPVWTWVGDNSAGKPILCDYLTDNFYISWPAGVDASGIKADDVVITLKSQYGDERVLKVNTKVKTNPEDKTFVPDGEYSVFSSKDTTQVSVNLINWAYTPVYTTMAIEVKGSPAASKVYDVGSVYQYSVQMGGGLDYDKTVTAVSVFGIADLESYTTEQLIKEQLTYSYVFRDPEVTGMGAPTLVLIEKEDGTYDFARQQQGPNPTLPEGATYPTDGDVRLVGHTFYYTNHEGEKKVILNTDDEAFAKFNGQEVTFTKSYNYGMGPLGKIDKSVQFKVADGYVKTANGNYNDHMNWAWLNFIEGDNAGWIDPNFVPSQQQSGGPQGGGPQGGQQGGPQG